MENLCSENEFYLQQNKNQFHINDFIFSLAFKRRLEATQKWPIFVSFLFFFFSDS